MEPKSRCEYAYKFLMPPPDEQRLVLSPHTSGDTQYSLRDHFDLPAESWVQS